MNRVILYLFSFLVLLTFVYSEPSTPLRGTLKDVGKQSSSESSDSSKKEDQLAKVSDIGSDDKKLEENDAQKSNENPNAVSNPRPSASKRSGEVSTETLENQKSGEPSDDVGEGGTGADSGVSSGSTSVTGAVREPEDEEEVATSGTTEATTTTTTEEPTTKDNNTPQVSDGTTNSETNTPKTEENGSENPPNQTSECGDTFIMWFSEGIAVTTIKCDKYSVIYTGNESGEPKPKYIKGEVQTVEVSGRTVNVNKKNLSTISEDPNSPTDTSLQTSIKARLLGEEGTATLQDVKVYSFPIGNREITVKLPNSNEAGKRDKYTLSSGDETFYSGSENNSKYSIKDNGDLVDSTGKVVLKGDSSSSAIKNIYSVSSLFAILISVLMF